MDVGDRVTTDDYLHGIVIGQVLAIVRVSSPPMRALRIWHAAPNFADPSWLFNLTFV